MARFKASWTRRPWKRLPYTPTKVSKQDATTIWHLNNLFKTQSERFLLWLQGRQSHHYGPKVRIPELFQRRDLPYFALEQGRLKKPFTPLLTTNQNLSHAMNSVAALEERLGYRFKNRMTGIQAIKNTGPEKPLHSDGKIYSIEPNRRLALLGDRALDMVCCEMWFLTRHSTRDYNALHRDLLSRHALAMTGRTLQLHEIIMIEDARYISSYCIAETFEAIIGAIYVDSGYDLDVVKDVVQRLKLTDHPMLKSQEGPGIQKNNEILTLRDGPEITGHKSPPEECLEGSGGPIEQTSIQTLEPAAELGDVPIDQVIQKGSLSITAPELQLRPQPMTVNHTNLLLSRLHRVRRRSSSAILRVHGELQQLMLAQKSKSQYKLEAIKKAMKNQEKLRRFGTEFQVTMNLSKVLQMLVREINKGERKKSKAEERIAELIEIRARQELEYVEKAKSQTEVVVEACGKADDGSGVRKEVETNDIKPEQKAISKEKAKTRLEREPKEKVRRTLTVKPPMFEESMEHLNPSPITESTSRTSGMNAEAHAVPVPPTKDLAAVQSTVGKAPESAKRQHPTMVSEMEGTKKEFVENNTTTTSSLDGMEQEIMRSHEDVWNLSAPESQKHAAGRTEPKYSGSKVVSCMGDLTKTKPDGPKGASHLNGTNPRTALKSTEQSPEEEVPHNEPFMPRYDLEVYGRTRHWLKTRKLIDRMHPTNQIPWDRFRIFQRQIRAIMKDMNKIKPYTDRSGTDIPTSAFLLWRHVLDRKKNKRSDIFLASTIEQRKQKKFQRHRKRP